MNLGRLTRIAVALSLVAALGCKDSTSPPPTVTGRWQGVSATSSGTPFTVTLTLAEADQNVTGSGLMASSLVSIALVATGTNVHPNVSLTMTSTGYQPMNFTGTFSGTGSITGTLNGSGFVQAGIAFARQP